MAVLRVGVRESATSSGEVDVRGSCWACMSLDCVGVKWKFLFK